VLPPVLPIAPLTVAPEVLPTSEVAAPQDGGEEALPLTPLASPALPVAVARQSLLVPRSVLGPLAASPVLLLAGVTGVPVALSVFAGAAPPVGPVPGPILLFMPAFVLPDVPVAPAVLPVPAFALKSLPVKLLALPLPGGADTTTGPS
jgi:hypothetical protein